MLCTRTTTSICTVVMYRTCQEMKDPMLWIEYTVYLIFTLLGKTDSICIHDTYIMAIIQMIWVTWVIWITWICRERALHWLYDSENWDTLYCTQLEQFNSSSLIPVLDPIRHSTDFYSMILCEFLIHQFPMMANFVLPQADCSIVLVQLWKG